MFSTEYRARFIAHRFVATLSGNQTGALFVITVTVQSSNSGRPQSGCRVSVHWACSWSEGSTDRNGSVNLQGGPGRGTIYVRGTKVRQGYLSGNVSVYS